MTDLIDAIAIMRMAFKKEYLEPPTVLLLGSPDEGRRFLTALRQTKCWATYIGSPDLGKPIEMADGSVWMEVELVGIKVRWPANRVATHDGSWSFT